MVAHDLAPAGPLAVAVGNAMLRRDFLSTKRSVPLVGTRLVGHYPPQLDELIPSLGAGSREYCRLAITAKALFGQEPKPRPSEPIARSTASG